MRTSLADLLATGKVLLADGATGTNFFAAGLTAGEPPEFWTVDRPEEVARLHLEKIGAKLTLLTKDQASYLGVPVEGPYKPEHYRY